MPEEKMPREVKNHYEKAQIAFDRRNYKYAIDLLSHAINIKPDFAKGRQLLRITEIRQIEENPPNALAVFIRKVFSLIPMFLAMLNEMKGNFHDAMAIYEEILRNDPKNPAALIKLGILLKLEGMEEAAVVTLESAAEVAKKRAIVYELLGEMHSNLGNYERARQCFKKVIELKPHDHTAERGLKNLDALTTIDKSFDKSKGGFNVKEISE